VPPPGRGGLTSENLLDRLATVAPSRVPGLAVGIEQLCRAAGEGPVVCLLGAVGPDDLTGLVRGRSGPSRDAAILADIESWADSAQTRGRRAPNAASREVLSRQRDEAVALLRAAGWRVAVARADRSVADVWAELGQPVHVPTTAAGPLGVGA
jgi:hypothetical protein